MLLSFQFLEGRTLLSATLSADGELFILGTELSNPVTSGIDNVRVTSSGSQLVVTLNGKKQTFPASKVRSLRIETGSGADTILSNATVPTTLRGGAGDDNVTGFYPKTVLLDDYVAGSNSIASLPRGGLYKYQWEGPGPIPPGASFKGVVSSDNGQDFEIGLSVTFPGTASFVGGGLRYVPHLTLGFTNGADSLVFSSDMPIALDVAGGGDTAVLLDAGKPNSSNIVTVLGGNGDDRLESKGGVPCLLSGRKGNDTLISSPVSRQTLLGNSGSDTADYSARAASVRITLDNKPNDGQSGEEDNVMADVERILGGSGNDYLQGNPLNNYIAGNGGNDTLWGGDGIDTLAGGGGKDRLYGQAGNDLLAARGGSKDFLDGGSGFDTGARDDGPGLFDVVNEVEKFI